MFDPVENATEAYLDRQSTEYDFLQAVYGVMSLYQDVMSPKQISEALKYAADQETKKFI